jgi:acetyl-CoA carboxylase carboxyl transferase subunit alpha
LAVLDFEKKLHELEEQIDVAKIKGDTHAVETLKKELEKEIKKTFKNLTPYQKLLLARHPDRPHAIDIIKRIMDEKYELHGDREFRDDESIICFIGKIGDEKCVVIGEEKGRNTKEKN